ncbi:effector-associated constant component EACC1 [Actinomadura luteofluorescens]|uniref:effector-associated constant component EACC1 n=1 Tax=Actinomadura luteofluorescens TaxID=46163 RepID=UPI0035E43757
MQVAVVTDENDLRSLYQWLRRDDSLRGLEVHLSHAPPRPDDMGPVPALIQAVLEPQGVVTAFISGVVTWAAARRKVVRIRVRDGEKEVEISGTGIKDPEEVAARIVRDLHDS